MWVVTVCFLNVKLKKKIIIIIHENTNGNFFIFEPNGSHNDWFIYLVK
jgi:hypothetical protein